MPPAVKFIIVALVLYSTAIWSERLRGQLFLWMVVMFACGLLCDLTGTTLMFLSAKARGSIHVHTIAGYLALAIMLLHLIWAVLALKSTKYEERFTRFSVFAWGIWVLAFTTGAVFR